jgi:hypothetical protein
MAKVQITKKNYLAIITKYLCYEKSKIFMAKSPTKRIHLQVYKNISFQAGFASQRLINKDPTVD